MTIMKMTATYFEERETQDPVQREVELMGRLPGFLTHAMTNSPAWARRLEGVDPTGVSSRTALARLPLLRKLEIAGLQAQHPPFGGLTTRNFRDLPRIFMSPGAVFEPQGLERDPWRTTRALWAAGVRPGDVIHNCFSYHLTPGAWVVDTAARAIGCVVVPAGVGNTDQQVEALLHFRPDTYVGTPSFLRIIIERARSINADTSCLRRALVSGEPLAEDLRRWFQKQGVEVVRQWYGTADAGTVAYETSEDAGMVVEEDIILELVKPGTGEPVVPGEIGEIVLTNFNQDYPMIRFATGDLSAELPGVSKCGRTNMRIRGWLGRADQGVKVRGMFIYPLHVQQLVNRLDFLETARLVVRGELGRDELTLECELKDPTSEIVNPHMLEQIARTARAITKLRIEAVICPNGTIEHNTARLIDNRRHD